MSKKKSMGKLVLFILVGGILGSVVGEILGTLFGYFYPGSMVEMFFLETFTYTFPPATIPLVIFSLTFGFSLKVNVISILGIGVVAYYFRWY